MATIEDVTALAAAVWPEASNITVQEVGAGHVAWSGPHPPTSGFVVLANDAGGGIIGRAKAETLDDLQAEVEKLRQSTGEQSG